MKINWSIIRLLFISFLTCILVCFAIPEQNYVWRSLVLFIFNSIIMYYIIDELGI